MTWLSLVLSVAAVLTSIALYLHERSERRDAIRDERSDREEALELLRRQGSRDELEHRNRTQADLRVVQGQSSGGVSRDSYTFLVTNVGGAPAREAIVQLGGNEEEPPIGSSTVEPPVLTTGQVGTATVEIPRNLRGRPIEIVAYWADPSAPPDRKRRMTFGTLVHVHHQ